MTNRNREEQKEQKRPSRASVYEANRNKLVVKGLDHANFMYRWVNDVDDRVPELIERGWEVCQKNGQPVGEGNDGRFEQSAGTSSIHTKGMGGGITGVLMRMPREVYLDLKDWEEQEYNAKLEADMLKSVKENFHGRVDIQSRKRTGPFS